MLDRIDETFKYDRAKQEAVVQALLQAEARVSLFDAIGLAVFLRTDLFELYDIQEKNKLVSRTLTLDWEKKTGSRSSSGISSPMTVSNVSRTGCERRTGVWTRAPHSKSCFPRASRNSRSTGGSSTRYETAMVTSRPAWRSYCSTSPVKCPTGQRR
jgi:hypothetical protein